MRQPLTSAPCPVATLKHGQGERHDSIACPLLAVNAISVRKLPYEPPFQDIPVPYRSFLIPFLVCAALFAGCTRQAPDEQALELQEAARAIPFEDTTLVDALGREVTFQYPPGRVLSLAPNLTEIIYAIGAGEHLAAASQADSYPPAVERLPRFSTFPLEPERLVALAPDVLLATDQINSPSDADALLGLGLPTYFFSFEQVGDVPLAMRRLGTLLDRDGEQAARRFEARVARVQDATADLKRPRTLLLIGDQALYAFGEGSYASEAVRLAGGDNLTDAFEGLSAVLADEWVLDAQPDVIVVLSDEGDAYRPAALVEQHPSFKRLPAVRNQRVYGLHPDLLSRPGPRLAEGIEALARLLHPDTSNAP